jgi:hypothetical protein
MQSSDLNEPGALARAEHFAPMSAKGGRRFSIAERLTWVTFCPQSANIGDMGLPKI